jgi:hypothetical protein
MDMSCGKYSYVRTEFWWVNLKERDHLKDEVLEGRTILERIIKKLVGGMGWIRLAQDRDKLRAVTNATINFLVP